jgi:hypothetical protein
MYFLLHHTGVILLAVSASCIAYGVVLGCMDRFKSCNQATTTKVITTTPSVARHRTMRERLQRAFATLASDSNDEVADRVNTPKRHGSKITTYNATTNEQQGPKRKLGVCSEECVYALEDEVSVSKSKNQSNASNQHGAFVWNSRESFSSLEKSYMKSPPHLPLGGNSSPRKSSIKSPKKSPPAEAINMVILREEMACLIETQNCVDADTPERRRCLSLHSGGGVGDGSCSACVSSKNSSSGVRRIRWADGDEENNNQAEPVGKAASETELSPHDNKHGVSCVDAHSTPDTRDGASRYLPAFQLSSPPFRKSKTKDNSSPASKPNPGTNTSNKPNNLMANKRIIMATFSDPASGKPHPCFVHKRQSQSRLGQKQKGCRRYKESNFVRTIPDRHTIGKVNSRMPPVAEEEQSFLDEPEHNNVQSGFPDDGVMAEPMCQHARKGNSVARFKQYEPGNILPDNSDPACLLYQKKIAF